MILESGINVNIGIVYSFAILAKVQRLKKEELKRYCIKTKK